jgi:hypothetical protein
MLKIQAFTYPFKWRLGEKCAWSWDVCYYMKRGTNISFLTPKNVYYKLPEVFSELTCCNHLLIGNVNSLEEIMNKFVEGSINVKRNKLEFIKRMMTLLT